ncbi:hypothetical protein F2P81_002601 [Scophthalmus maximus]|uniref:Phosphatidylinositol transfer protein beta isoform n=1 Tax=Scophthalmus maximus TaxID=52904 RepID=A0A6A4TVK8_SCOMX|nr:hypothetical protein F2P81_002601 [Scophthalmus maximus]
MVLIKEYRVVLPVSVEELVAVGDFVSLKHLRSNNNSISHSCYGFVTNEYMKDDFMIKIETWHKPDMGTVENVHDLDEQTWRTVEVVPIDIANKEEVAPADYKPEEDPALFHSAKTDRGPLGPEWKNELKTDCPYMCAYKLVTVKFRWWGLQTKVESFIHRQEKRIFTNFHRQLFCWIDKWVGLTMEDIRRMEEETQKELEEVINLPNATIPLAFRLSGSSYAVIDLIKAEMSKNAVVIFQV